MGKIDEEETMKYSYVTLLLAIFSILNSFKTQAQGIVRGGNEGIILEYTGFTVSFNSQTKLPNWVAYELTKEETEGQVKRNSNFYPDPELKVKQADNNDYRNTGWDRGHMAPAGDMKWSEQAMFESCYFTNICPQNKNLNGGDWRALEERCRTWAQKYGKVQIVCGPILGDMKNGTLGDNKVAIPDAFFKVLLVKIADVYEGIGFIFENKAGHKNLGEYAMSIDSVEHITGLDFFHQLPNRVENKLEANYHKDVWAIK